MDEMVAMDSEWVIYIQIFDKFMHKLRNNI